MAPFARPASVALTVLAAGGALLADPATTTVSTNPPPDALSAKPRLRLAPGLRLDLWASEPLIQNTTSVSYDHLGRAYVVESGRRRTSVFDVRGLQPWLEDDFALRTEADRAALLRRVLDLRSPDYPAFLEAVNKGGRGGFQDFNRDGVIDWHDLEVESERIRLVADANGDGTADTATTFADGFNGITSGVAAGVLTEGTNVWFACIPDLWKLPAGEPGRKGAGEQTLSSPLRPGSLSPLLSGFGVHIAFGGHDLHGLLKGPDGRIYFTIADRGACVTNREGKVISLPDTGAVFRCEPDGSNFEVFAQGLRNPQELAFDDFGNLWTADNNGDGGDKARWTLLLEGADYGWTIGWQWLPKMGAWNSERLWHTRESNSAAYIVPPVAHIGHGPAGIAHYPGTGLGDRYRSHFFYADFPGGIRHFRVEPDGAFFKVRQADGAGDSWNWLEDNSAANLTGKLLWDLSPVDVAFPPFGGVIIADWVQGWEKTGKGRLWHVTDPTLASDPQIAEVRRLLAEGMAKRSERELLALLGHRDQRVRLEAQWELAGRGPAAWKAFSQTARQARETLPRLHALWGLDQLVRSHRSRDFVPELTELIALLKDADPLVRGHTARLLGAAHLVVAQNPLLELFSDPDPRVATAAVQAYRDLFSAFGNGPSGGLRFRPTWQEKLFERLPGFLQRQVSTPQQSGAVLWPTLQLGPLLQSPAGKSPALVLGAARLLEEVGNTVGSFSRTIFLQNLNLLTTNSSSSVRLSVLLAERRLSDPQVSSFFRDASPQLVLEAARAVNDVPIPAALPALSALLQPGALGHVRWPEEDGSDPLNFTRDEWRTWVLRRAVNAAFRVGGDTNAAALAEFATRADTPESVRVEALEDLADWAQPPRRDRVVGLHRPLPARDPAPARNALAAVWPRLTTPAVATNVLLATLRASAVLQPAGFATTLNALASHPSPAVRAEVTKLSSSHQSVSVAELVARLDSGSPAQQQDAFARLAGSKDAAAAEALIPWLQRLPRGQVPKELQLDVLAAAAQLGAPRLTPLLAAWTNALPKDDPLSRYRVALHGGDAANGRKLFAERADWGCQRCHKLGGEGGDVGPDLTGLGRTRGRDYVLRAMLEPNAEIAAGFETVVLELKDDSTVIGILKEETAGELVVITPEAGRVSVKKPDIKSRDRGLSAMPDGLGDLMTLRELRDVIEALSQ